MDMEETLGGGLLGTPLAMDVDEPDVANQATGAAVSHRRPADLASSQSHEAERLSSILLAYDQYAGTGSRNKDKIQDFADYDNFVKQYGGADSRGRPDDMPAGDMAQGRLSCEEAGSDDDDYGQADSSSEEEGTQADAMQVDELDGAALDLAMEDGAPLYRFSNSIDYNNVYHPDDQGDISDSDEPDNTSEPHEPEYSIPDLWNGVCGWITNQWVARRWDEACKIATESAAKAPDRMAYAQAIQFEIARIDERINRFAARTNNDQPEHGELDGVALAADFLRFLKVPIEDQLQHAVCKDAVDNLIPLRPVVTPIDGYVLATINEARKWIIADIQHEMADIEREGLGSESTGEFDIAAACLRYALGSDADSDIDETSDPTPTEPGGHRVQPGLEDLVSQRANPDGIADGADLDLHDIPDDDDIDDDEVRELQADEVNPYYAPDTAEQRARFLIHGGDYEVYIPTEFQPYIRQHQIDGVRFMWRRVVTEQSGALLLHAPGLGKTLQVIALISAIRQTNTRIHTKTHLPDRFRVPRVVVLSPAAVVGNWSKQFNESGSSAGLPVLSVTSGQTPAERMHAVGVWATSSAGGILLTSYDMLKWLGGRPRSWKVLTMRTSLLVIDEVHCFRNGNTGLSRFAGQFRTTHRIGLTGTPVANSLQDMFHIVDWAVKDHPFKTLDYFNKKFQRPILSALDKGLDLTSTEAYLQYDSVISDLTHRRSERDLDTPMPAKTEFFLSLTITPAQMRLYNKLVEDRHNKKRNFLTMVHMSSLLLAHPHLDMQEVEVDGDMDVVDYDVPDDFPAGGDMPGRAAQAGNAAAPRSSGPLMPDFPDRAAMMSFMGQSTKVCILLEILRLARNMRESVLVFSQKVASLKFLKQACRLASHRVFYIDGAVAADSRQGIVNDFNITPGPAVFVISTRVGGVGLNIQRASRVVLFDFSYSPAIEEVQAIARAYRFGQEKPVFVYWLMVATTNEASIQHTASFKRQLAGITMDGEQANSAEGKGWDAFGFKAWIPDRSDRYTHQRYLHRDAILDRIMEGDMGNELDEVLTSEDILNGHTFKHNPADYGLSAMNPVFVD
ncbi:P-loop containing nucleoside triphosphate hydrolase protein [Coniochaeta sp. 2T2.1]|nr:P-loop containing nucleoside triphosphate hydrolase protein [Coniochaeta sp. 2T2.1]